MTSQKTRVALISLLASVGLTIGKFTVALATGSLGILSDAFHSLMDIGATAITFFAVRVSDKPADEEHHYGHGKIESVTALAETGLLFVIAGWIVYEAIHRLIAPGNGVEVTWWAVAVICGSMVVDFNRSRALKRAAEATRSEALAADALHFASDLWSSAAVLIGLAATWAGFPAGDSFAAIVVAIVVGLAGYRLGRRTIESLTDTAPAGYADIIANIARDAEGVLALKRARIRRGGSTVFIDADVNVRRTFAFDRVNAIKAKFIDRVHREIEDADISLTAHPVALDDETIFDKVMLVAARRGVAVHHLTVQHVSDALSVSFDIEVDADWPYWKAHDVASGLEEAIRNELGDDVEVESHIEPADVIGVDGADVSEEMILEVVDKLEVLAESHPLVTHIHDVRVRRNRLGLFVTLHCWVDRTRSVDEVHTAVDRFERAFRESHPGVRRIVTHAEPHGAER
ncbi:cation-efflux pump [Rhodobium gokarnense]|uniref:Cation diffusion facilitator family transporter n=1 Tax=Rhodobium gokarnense TaxID=364296 RepID=A0ABT3H735_9HYPH|nr:cation-efflux pump [Rhodobium gokarnense]MCW2306208.1 cation diffusion facilitator family transporter [Rhodobium gokarnense]